ncbi:MAG TPA: hypothetical protein VNJ29_02910 [Candidatus Nitrosotenuis sp.]|nr:hypothetical protein [Candidatus Nitrosotenuis sp.]
MNVFTFNPPLTIASVPLAKTLKPNGTALKQRDNYLMDTLSQLNRLTADAQAIAGKVLFFAHAHFLFFNYGRRAFGTFAFASNRAKPTHWTKAKEPNFARAL